VERLAEDHANAKRLAQGLAEIHELGINPEKVQTNMTFFNLEKSVFTALQHDLREQGILISGRDRVRLVTHLDVTRSDVDTVIKAFKDHFSSHAVS
jgi:threonine aldolase